MDKKAFIGFDPEKVAVFKSEKIETLLENPGIIRNRQLRVQYDTDSRAGHGAVVRHGPDWAGICTPFEHAAQGLSDPADLPHRCFSELVSCRDPLWGPGPQSASDCAIVDVELEVKGRSLRCG